MLIHIDLDTKAEPEAWSAMLEWLSKTGSTVPVSLPPVEVPAPKPAPEPEEAAEEPEEKPAPKRRGRRPAAKPAPEPEPEDEPEEEQADEEEDDDQSDLLGGDATTPEYTMDDALAKGSALIGDGKAAVLKRAIKQCGVARVGELTPKLLPKFFAAIEE